MRKMTFYAGVLLVALLAGARIQAASTDSDTRESPAGTGVLRAVEGLAQRVAPWLSPHLVLEQIPKDQGNDVFELGSRNGQIVIRASSASSAAVGLNWYLKYYCHRSISHLGNNMSRVKPLPTVPQGERHVAQFQYRYYLNYCTFSYTFAFTDWKGWERELDWMALNGVNLALATTGSEAVWQNTLRRIGYSENEILEFFPGPAYTAWWLMGNFEGWGGPITQRMIDERSSLQRKILARMREFGIEPVLQGFYGMVPASLAKKYPIAKIIDQGDWNGFRRPMILLSSDPLFARLATIYYEEMKKLYGPAKYFGGDLFHEGGKTDGLNVAALAKGVQDAMQEAQPGATWILQGWQENPKDELLEGLQKDRIIVLNMESDAWEKRKGFQGAPWIWGIINNFGENVGMFGDLERIAAEPSRAAASPYGKEMAGVGSLMEGINNNPVVYDLLFETAWRNGKVDLSEWIHGYVQYRYGRSAPGLERAWELLVETAYSPTAGSPQSIYCARPSLQVKGVSTWGSTNIGYDEGKLEEAAREFLSAQSEMGKVDAYQLDAVDLVRQVVANRGLEIYRNMIAAYAAKDKIKFNQDANTFRSLLKEQDELLGTRREFLLGNWLGQAKTMARTEEEAAQCEKNARMQITYWGPDDPGTEALDYASKEWSGLLDDFYLKRWEMFIGELNARLDGKSEGKVNYFEFEKSWAEQRKAFPAAPTGDALSTATRLFSHVSEAAPMKSARK